MKRLLTALTLLAMLTLASCVPQFVGTGPLSAVVTSETETTITLLESEAAFDLVVYIGGAELVRPVGDLLTCEPFEKGFTCELAEGVVGSQPQILRPPVNLTILAYSANPRNVTANAWYSVPGKPDRIARATVP